MQVLKAEIKKRILKESLSLFYKKGYEKTSTRDIAYNSDISLGNLYKYFRNKEAIFDTVIKDYYENYRDTMVDYLSRENSGTFDEERVSELTEAILYSIKGKRKQFVILMDRSEGTRYSDFKNKVIFLLEQHIRNGVKKYVKDEFIVTICAHNFFNGIIDIALKYKTHKWAYYNIYMLVKYHIAGVAVLR